MSAPVTTLLDGNWIKPDTTGAPRFTYPFRLNGDRVSAYFEQDYLQQAATPTAPLPFVPSALSTPHETLRDFYLIAETPPIFGLANLLGFTRTYSRIPSTQISYSSQAISKPSPSSFGTASGFLDDWTGASGFDVGVFGVQGYTYGGYYFAQNQVYTQKTGSATTTLPTGGTFTITYKTSTTAPLAYNALNAVINAAINALADVITDGITVSVTNLLNTGSVSDGQIAIALTVGSTSTRFTMGVGSLTPANAALASFTAIYTPTTQAVCVACILTYTAHAANTALPLLVNAGVSSVAANLIPYGTSWSVIDANRIAINWAAVFQGRYTALSGVFGQYYRAYTPGTDRVGTKLSQAFYLPGLTAGITTPADIPIPDPLLNDLALVNSLLANLTGYQTYDSTALAQWMASPIYTQTAIQINMADL